MFQCNYYVCLVILFQSIVYEKPLLFMVAYFCHHLLDNYVDSSDLYVVLLDLYVVLPDLYVDLPIIHLLENKSCPVNAIQIATKL